MNGEVEGWVKGDSQPIFRYYASIYVEGMSKIRRMPDLRLPPQSSRELCSSGLLHSE